MKTTLCSRKEAYYSVLWDTNEAMNFFFVKAIRNDDNDKKRRIFVQFWSYFWGQMAVEAPRMRQNAMKPLPRIYIHGGQNTRFWAILERFRCLDVTLFVNRRIGQLGGAIR